MRNKNKKTSQKKQVALYVDQMIEIVLKNIPRIPFKFIKTPIAAKITVGKRLYPKILVVLYNSINFS